MQSPWVYGLHGCAMESLEQRQLEMKARNARKQRRKDPAPAEATLDEGPGVLALKKRISELQEQVLALQIENSRLREQKTILVERPRDRAQSGDSAREQQHNFFKYSNARNRY
jgi:hypothetical protein